MLSVYIYLYSSRHSYSYSWLKAGALGGVWVEKQEYNSLETHMSDQRWEEDRQSVRDRESKREENNKLSKGKCIVPVQIRGRKYKLEPSVG